MKTNLKLPTLLAAGTLLAALFGHPTAAQAQGTAFTYQGRLNAGTSPAAGTYNLTFSLYGTSTGNTLLAGPVAENAIVVTNGLFTTTVDFGPGVFIAATNWLQIAVATNGSMNFTNLTPRQQVTPTPYALYAESANATNLVGSVQTANLSGVALLTGGNNFTGNQNVTGGNVGIGTASPGAQLDVSGTFRVANSAGAFQYVGFAAGPAQTSVLGQFSTSDTNYPLLRFYRQMGGNLMDVGEDGSGNFGVFGNTAELMTVQAGGNVGIGTTSPLALTEIRTATSARNLVLSGPGGGTYSFYDTTGSSYLWDVNGSTNGFTISRSGIDYPFTIDTAHGNAQFAHKVGIGTNAPSQALEVNGNAQIDGAVIAAGLNVGSTFIVQSRPGNAGSNNFFAGAAAGLANTTGIQNTFVGTDAGFANTSGGGNSFYGYTSGARTTIGNSETFMGNAAGFYNTIGDQNTFLGAGAGQANTNGSYNTFIGTTAGLNNLSGSNNIALGYQSGISLATGSSNIYIGNPGLAAENNTIRIGTPGTQTATYLAGVINGNGGGLTNLTGVNLAGVALLSGGNALTGNQTVTGGNVGIGTTTPGSLLTVNGTGSPSISLIGSATNGELDFGIAGFATAYSTSATANDAVIRQSGKGNLYLQTGSGAAAIAITTNNIVGIGTASPIAHLHVDGGVFETPVAAALFEVQNCGAACAVPTWTEGVRLMNSEGNDAGEVGMGFLTALAGTSLTNVPDAWIGTDDKASGNTHSFKIATQSGGVLTNRVFINGATGNVGIGTTAPTSPLDVAGSAHVSGTIRMGSETGTAEAPNRPGLVIRRINSTSTTAGSIVAVCPLALNTNANFTLVRDGSYGGFQILYPPSPGGEILTVACMGIDNTGAQKNFYESVSVGGGGGGSIQIYSNSQNIVHFECTFGDMDQTGDDTKVTLTRAATLPTNIENEWVGDLVSTHNQ